MTDTRLLIAFVMTVTVGFDQVLAKDCGSVDVRNFKDLGNLANCTVILGNLALVFPIPYGANYKAEEINSLRFPLRYVEHFC